MLETLLHTEVTELESEEKALSFLKNLDSVPSMIIYDYTPNAYLLEDFIGYLRDNSKLVRIVVLVDKIREEGKELLKDQHQMILMDESTLPGALVEESKKLFAGSPFLNEEQYSRIDINFLAILDGINKNLFIRIGNDKFIKIFHEDDNTDVLDLTKYKSKGINYFYLTRDTAMWVINQIQNQIDIFLKANNFRFVLRGASDSPEKRFEQKILRIDDEVHVDKDFKESIEKAVEKIRAIVEKEAKVDAFLRVLKENQNHYALFTQKMNLTSLMSCVLAKQLDWISKTTMDKLVYASVVSDITLAVRPELLKIPNLHEFERVKNTLSEEDQKIFLSHPKDAANLIKRYFTSAPPDTDALVYQHHEFPDGSGFPLGLRAEKISPLSALFIVATDFSFYYLQDDEPTMDDFLLKCHSRYDFVNFRKVIKALEKVKRR
ncbi:HD domain-containing phosphohydrolase [Peredibacter starrii]|uniref:HD domain-containing phosphohydrolase n=1 Tax=Peredibacter starrii TaxID=28202 RepID=A0AAX4HMR6_9BACT|nr:HD domain-containing phosphohydrolase [Peredibacter starrii]WPU64579.1 HD domain-containing phosphohydrolase [Peredibacter starrii]